MKIKYVLIFKIPASVDKELSTISPWDKHARVFCLMSATSIIRAWKTIHTEYILEYIQRISREGSGQGKRNKQ